MSYYDYQDILPFLNSLLMYDCQDILPFLHVPITSPLAARVSNRSVDSSLSTSIKVAMPRIGIYVSRRILISAASFEP